MNHDAPEAYDHILKCHRNPKTQQMTCHLPVPFPICFFYVPDAVFFKLDKTDRARTHLSQHSSQRGSLHAPVEYQHKYKIQDNIYGRRTDHGTKGRLAVTHGPKDTGTDIVKRRSRQSEHKDQQIIVGWLPDIVRNAKKPQQR